MWNIYNPFSHNYILNSALSTLLLKYNGHYIKKVSLSVFSAQL